MFTHVTESGVVYEVAVPEEEARQRVATIIGKLYPAFIRASARGGEETMGVVGESCSFTTEYTQAEACAWGLPSNPHRRTRARECQVTRVGSIPAAPGTARSME